MDIRSKEISTSRNALVRIVNSWNTKLIEGMKPVICADKLENSGWGLKAYLTEASSNLGS
jgi:hypothetical protein